MPQRKTQSNIGQYGVESIRLQGMTIDNLPIAESARVKLQLPIAEAAARQSIIEGIKARYPKQDCAYLESRIREAKGNIVRFREQLIRIGSDREEYKLLLRDVKRRDKEIKKVEDKLSAEDFQTRVRELNTEYGLWNRKGLEQQIAQFGVSIKRFEETIEKEQEAIDKLTELLGLCRARDKELTRLGA